jgi:hypothetical protein
MSSLTPKYGTFHEFEASDIYHNRIKTYPKVDFFIYSGSIYYNNENQLSGNSHTPNGKINLYELNVHRDKVAVGSDKQLIYPFITKEGSFTSFKTISTDSFNNDFVYGDIIKGSYPLLAGLSVDRYGATFSTAKKKVLYALKSSLDYHSVLSPHYSYSSSFGDKTTQKLNIISIPSIFYGSSIKKGSVELKYYITGTLLAQANDTYRNGVLYQTSGSTTGSSVGVVLYDEGFIILTSSAALSQHTEKYEPTNPNGSSPSATNASWYYFAATGSHANTPSSSYGIKFSGLNYVDTVTMFAHAKENQANFSNNPTFLTRSIIDAVTSSHYYHEDAQIEVKNIVSSSYVNHNATFQPVTYISKIGIYDKDKNLIAVAGLANPVRKLEERSYTFKLKLDI